MTRTFVYVVGTRPNFVKTAPVLAAMRARCPSDRHLLVHTGQHYDRALSDAFFDELGIPDPDHMLEVGSGPHGLQTARVLERFERLMMDLGVPDLVIVPGDVNSTLGCALATVKLGGEVAHLEAGLRSFDRTMPEEINRILTDQLSSLLFTHSPEALENLTNEGISAHRVHVVGNTMIDSLDRMRPRAEAAGVATRHGLAAGSYLLVTLHRPALVDGPLLADVVSNLARVADTMPVVFPVHPRTRARMATLGSDPGNVRLVEPVGYLEFLALEIAAAGVLTDSGGVQEETTCLGVPCFTLRENTERPITLSVGTNLLLGLDPERILDLPELLAERRNRSARRPDGWDGAASERVAATIDTTVRPGEGLTTAAPITGK